jgi:hypothetical protein
VLAVAEQDMDAKAVGDAGDGRPPSEEEARVEIHKPKPVHGWR